ncbi:hypothetical protein [Ralstonia solanacearum]|uniref:Transmembrane protein n=1 Tax=Ralstonia solanacearum TaxID=305 RepID=A0AAE3NLK0_RALSL|nr:hypothetical protein [Ralstonia solanacearum]MBB6580375.1 hypothetical protein [Ralstonia solanacearum]MDB0523996.1 hypothetical protein [Ralstonia solanacearum]
MTSTLQKTIPVRWLVVATWFLGVTIHLLMFSLSNVPKQGQEWYAARHSYKAVVFMLTRFPLWLTVLCILAIVAGRVHRAHSLR